MEQKDISVESVQIQNEHITYSSFSSQQMIHEQITPFLPSSTISLLAPKNKNEAYQVR